MNDIIKETIKELLSDKSKEELLDVLSDIFASSIVKNIGVQSIQSSTQKAIDSINAEFNELVKNEIDTSASILTTKLRDGGI